MEQPWQITLRIWEFIFLAACIVLALFSAYFFGYKAGHAIGYDDARKASLNTTARYEIFEDEPELLNTDQLDQIYAKLQTPPEKTVEAEDDQEVDEETNLSVPEVFQIKQNSADENHQNPESEETEIIEADRKPEPDKSRLKTNEERKEEERQKEEQAAIEQRAQAKKLRAAREAKELSLAEAAREKEQAEKAEEEKAAAVAPDRKIPSGWYVQVATSRNITAAQKLVSNLKNSGFPAQIESQSVGGKVFYRIMVGPESAQDYASRLQEQLARERYLSGKPFIKKIN